MTMENSGAPAVETTAAPEKQGKKTPRWVMPVVVAALVAVIGVLVYVLLNREDPAPEQPQGLQVGYAQGVTALDPDALQAAVDALGKAAEDQIALEYRNEAYSKDGKTFECTINNSPSNTYDLFISIYRDASMTDELYVSELLRPGTGFESITLDEALDPGTHTVHVAYTQVEVVDGQQAIHGQVVVTMTFIVES